MELPQGFEARISNVFGAAGRDWLVTLPRVLQRCRARWRLSESEPSPDMRLNYLEFCKDSSGARLALKVGVPHPELSSEMETLARYSGKGMVALVDTELADGALLLERVEPGTMLWRLGSEEERLSVFGRLLVSLRKSSERALRSPAITGASLPRYGDGFSRAAERARREARRRRGGSLWIPSQLLDRAEEALDIVLERSGPDTLLHADLHQENILLGPDGWIAIDPKGAIGPACLEVGRFIQNRLPGGVEARLQVLEERIQHLAEAAHQPAHLLACSSLVDCVLSLCWTLEEEEVGESFDDGLQTAELLTKWVAGGEDHKPS